MDELEISGKRYISTRRAAKEHKYHSDYIGQLIRAGKVEGQKVGRSWYVIADSLTEYLGKEGGAKMPTHVEAPKPILREVIKEVPEEIKEELPEVVEVAASEVEDVEEHHIAVKISNPQKVSELKKTPPVIHATRNSLRYIADDGPLYPRMERQPERQIQSRIPIRPMERRVEPVVEETEYVEEEPVVILERPRRAKKNTGFFVARGGIVLAVGVVTLGAVVALSAFVVSTTTVRGEAASVSYSLSNL